jgi:antitoxin HigA-1
LGSKKPFYLYRKGIQIAKIDSFNMKSTNNIHPGKILQEEFLIPLHITAYRLAKHASIPQTRISEIIKGNRRITADTALRFSIYFGNSPKFWLGLQDDYDLEEEKISKNQELSRIRHYSSNSE